MASVNKVILVGNCGRDPEVRYLPDGRVVANVSIATTSRRKNRDTGESVEDTQWHRVTFYDRLAEIAGDYVKKGKPVYVEGRLKYGTYTDKESGVEKTTCDIIATELQLLGSRDDAGGQQQYAPAPQRQAQPRQQQYAPAPQPQYAPAPPQRQAPPQQRPAQQHAPRQAPQPQPPSSGFNDMDDDIPF